MTKTHHAPAEPSPTLAERLAPMTIPQIDAMSTRRSPSSWVLRREIAAELAWTWRAAARAATDGYADKLVADVEAERSKVIADPAEIRRRLGGRPRIGGASDEGPSMQVRVRVETRTRTALEAIAADQGRRLADVSRDALDDYVARHVS